MDAYNIIDQIIKQLTDKQLPDERIPFLCPVDFIINSSDTKKAKETSEILCLTPPNRFKKTDALELNHVIIRDKALFEKLHHEIKDKVIFIEYLNRELFKYIQSQFSDLKELGVMDSDNMWYQPKKRFANWFSIKNIDPKSEALRTKNTDDVSSEKVGKIKKASIQIMITNKMRIELKTLGYSKEEMKELTPQKANVIIKKGIPKTPSKDRNRNQ
jgi:hypothetical protein